MIIFRIKDVVEVEDWYINILFQSKNLDRGWSSGSVVSAIQCGFESHPVYQVVCVAVQNTLGMAVICHVSSTENS